jgi:hypothetical protein
VLTTSPVTIPSPESGRTSSETSASPVFTARRTSTSPPRSPLANRERRAHGSLRVVLAGGRRAEDRDHRVADELLDRAAPALELGPKPLVVRPQERVDVLGVERLGACSEADEVGEEDGDDFSLPPGPCHPGESKPLVGKITSARCVLGVAAP